MSEFAIALTVLSTKKYTAIIRIVFLVSLLGLVTACSGNTTMPDWLSPDPDLQNNSSTPTPSPSETQPTQTPETLPEAFPANIPRYPTATIQTVEPGLTDKQGKTRWTSSDPSNAIAAFYQQQFQSEEWEIITPFASDGESGENTLVARKNDLEVSVSIASSASPTEFAIAYQRNNNSADSQTNNDTAPNQIASDVPLEFSDLDSISEPWRGYVQNLASLGVLVSQQDQDNEFKPNNMITRREYARWLVAANNKLFAQQANKQIRLAANTSKPLFKDVPANDSDFAVIQGLADAGFIASSLTGDNSALLFRPDTPLTREDLIAWKVAVDNRKALPSASLDQIKDTWGFQDAAKIDAKALRSLYADYQNGDRANFSRVFGSTTLFQPKKTVTRAEAAAALWYFGIQDEGISAQDALQIKEQPTATQ